MTTFPPVIYLVGHCGPDSFALRSAVGTMLPGATVEFVVSEEQLPKAMREGDVLLINRVLDGDFSSESGLELIRRLRGTGRAVLMLVSNFAEAQSEAEAAGAMPGFGKSLMLSDLARARLREAVAAARAGAE